MSIAAATCEAIRLCVPEGEGSAMTYREVWERFGQGSPISCRNYLTKLAADGAIHRRKRPTMGDQWAWEYWR